MSKHTDRGRAPRRSRKPAGSPDPRKLPPIPILDLPGSAARFEDIPELAIDIVPPATLKHLAKLDGKTLEAVAEIVIAILDAQAGDPEREEDQEDCCDIGEDIGSADRDTTPSRGRGHSIGDDDDAEEDNEDCCGAYDDIGTGRDAPQLWSGDSAAGDPEDTEHDDDDTDAAGEDVPTHGWFATPDGNGTATVAEYQKAIGDGRTGDDTDAEPDFEGEAEQDGFGNPMLGWSMQGKVWPEKTKDYTPGDPAPRSPFGYQAPDADELPAKRVRR